MIPHFNTAGACIPGEHYMLSPEPRFRHVMRLVDERKYFTLHAGRKTGKSTAARWLVDTYNAVAERAFAATLGCAQGQNTWKQLELMFTL